MKDKKRVTPEGLRRAARAVIIEGHLAYGTAVRFADERWARRLIDCYGKHEDALLMLAETNPPREEAELCLLERVRQGLSSSKASQLVAAAKLCAVTA